VLITMSQVRVLVGELPKRLILRRFSRADQSCRTACVSSSPPFPHLVSPGRATGAVDAEVEL
jgi:hypothetical protein